MFGKNAAYGETSILAVEEGRVVAGFEATQKGGLSGFELEKL